jgi:hypothetical protein
MDSAQSFPGCEAMERKSSMLQYQPAAVLGCILRGSSHFQFPLQQHVVCKLLIGVTKCKKLGKDLTVL